MLQECDFGLPSVVDMMDQELCLCVIAAATLQAENYHKTTETISCPTTKLHTRNYKQISGSWALALIEALWSPEIVAYYGWSQAGEGQ
ncbi:hypothetical protein LTR56_027169, partial [Elasticomyces elasticus]